MFCLRLLLYFVGDADNIKYQVFVCTPGKETVLILTRIFVQMDLIQCLGSSREGGFYDAQMD